MNRTINWIRQIPTMLFGAVWLCFYLPTVWLVRLVWGPVAMWRAVQVGCDIFCWMLMLLDGPEAVATFRAAVDAKFRSLGNPSGWSAADCTVDVSRAEIDADFDPPDPARCECACYPITLAFPLECYWLSTLPENPADRPIARKGHHPACVHYEPPSGVDVVCFPLLPRALAPGLLGIFETQLGPGWMPELIKFGQDCTRSLNPELVEMRDYRPIGLTARLEVRNTSDHVVVVTGHWICRAIRKETL